MEIREFIVNHYLPDVTPAQLDGDYDLLANGVIDSLGLLKLITWLEERFALNIDDMDISPEMFKSVAAIQRVVEEGH